jgi:cell division protein FtsW
MKYAATTLMICVCGLMSLGLVILSSSTMDKGGPNPAIMQAIWCGLGIAAAVVVAAMDYRHLRRVSWLIYAIAVVLLICVLVPGIGKKVSGARRWIFIAQQGFQPSEFAKIALIVFLAKYCEQNQRFMSKFWRGLAIPGLWVGLVLVLVFLEPDWGTTVLTAAVSGVMLLVAGVRWRHLMAPTLAGIVALTVLLMNNEVRSKRVSSWLNPEATRQGTGYQAWQGAVALGSGGLTGLGLGEGRQKFGYLPAKETDFILAIIGEEFGLVGTMSVLALFVGVLICGVYIAWNARDTFGLLLATGMTFLIGLQAFINMGVVTGTLPNKGLPLPFISRGGSNLFLSVVCVGVLLSIAHRAGAASRKSPFEIDELPVPQTS